VNVEAGQVYRIGRWVVLVLRRNSNAAADNPSWTCLILDVALSGLQHLHRPGTLASWYLDQFEHGERLS